MAASGTEPQFRWSTWCYERTCPFSRPVGILAVPACHTAAATPPHGQLPSSTPPHRGTEHTDRVILEAPEETSLKFLAEHNIDHVLWLQQLENTSPCTALGPARRTK